MRIINTYREPVDPEKKLSPKEIVALCCKKTPVDPCSEVGRVGVYDGADEKHRDFDEKATLAQARADYPNARIISVKTEGIGPPPGTPCGELHETWEGRNNCCEGAIQLSWDMHITPEILPHNGKIIIAWKGSDGREVTVKTSSNATWFSDGRKTAIGHGNSIELSAGPSFCGNTTVSVTDNCSVAFLGIRSDLGQWLNRGPVCQGLRGEPALVSGVFVIESGKYRQLETLSPGAWYVFGLVCGMGSGHLCLSPPCPEAFCAAVSAAKPPGAGPRTCMDINMVDYTASMRWDYFCTMADGSVIGTSNGWTTSYNCSASYGAAHLAGGFYGQTASLNLQEWSC